ncbi:MAG: 50S ribosomal protein L4 [Candidatus Bilamarchaeaceae archaeon]
MKANVYSLDGSPAKQIELPKQFSEEVREEIIRRAVLSDESKEYQPKGAFPFAGIQTSAEYRGRKEAYGSLKNRGQAMLPREIRPKGLMGKVRRIPSSVKGRRAHPPKVEKVLVERMNKKEYRKALVSAIAATADISRIRARGHEYSGAAPVVFEDSLEKLGKTKEVVNALWKIVGADLEKAKKGRKARTGTRKRKSGTKTPKGALIVVAGGKINLAARNIAGVDVVSVDKLRVKDLAPGTHAGRLTVYTEAALKKIAEL